MVKFELFYGASEKWQSPKKFIPTTGVFGLDLFVSLPLDDLAAKKAGEIRSNLAALGTPIDPDDLLIAAIAIVNNLTLVTHNTREFERVSELRVEDWQV